MGTRGGRWGGVWDDSASGKMTGWREVAVTEVKVFLSINFEKSPLVTIAPNIC